MTAGFGQPRVWRWVSVGVRIAVPSAVLALVWRELIALDWGSAWAVALASDHGLVAGSLIAALVAVAVMGLYDALSFRDTGRLTALRRWGLGSMLFAWTNFLTMGPIGGPAARIIIYRKNGAPISVVIGGLGRLYIGMLGGLFGWLLAVLAPIEPVWEGIATRAGIAIAGSVAGAMLAGRLLSLIRPTAWRAGPGRLALLGLVGALDWGGVLATFTLSGAAVGSELPLVEQARAMFLGHLAGMLSMIPGGLGSADAVWLKTLTVSGAAAETTAAQIMLFRVIYYIIPWLLAVLALNVVFAEQWKRLLAERRVRRRVQPSGRA